MKEIMHLLLILVFLNLISCSDSKDESPQYQPKTYTEYKEVTNVNTPVKSTLNSDEYAGMYAVLVAKN